MSRCRALLFGAVLLAASEPRLFTSDAPIELTLEAPLQQLFEKGTDDEKFSVRGVVSYRDAAGADVVVPDVEISVRGHTSKRETECSFPKLKIKFEKADAGARGKSIFAGLDGLRIGTHCGETPGEERTAKFGRLANENSPLREALVYRLLDAAGVPTLKARLARITYVDKTRQASPIVRNAMLVEDDDDLMKRLDGRGEITMDQFTNARDRFAPRDTAILAFAQAMIANFDWCLRFSPDDMYRCHARQPLWNVMAITHGDGRAVPVIADFDLAGMVVGHHNWFDNVYYPGFVPSRSSIEIEVISQVQHTRSVFPRAQLDETRRYFLGRKPALYEVLSRARVDPRGRELAQQHLDAFFNAIATDSAFYRPVVVKADTRVYLDPAKSSEACGTGDTVLPGTPVTEVRREGTMVQVGILDARWHWAPPAECQAVKTRPVWIEADAVGVDYPEK